MKMQALRYDPLKDVNNARRDYITTCRETALTSSAFRFDRAIAERCCHSIGTISPKEVKATLKTRSRSLVAHLVNGLGNFKIGARNGVYYLFEDLGINRHGGIAQCSERTQSYYHPWQSFAYSVMAGVEPDYEFGRAGNTIRRIATNSRSINLRSHLGNYDLGHLLFAAAHLVPDGNFEFEVNGQKINLSELVDGAFRAMSLDAEYTVCDRAHLLEGLFAATTLVPKEDRFRGEVQGLLEEHAKVAGLILAKVFECQLGKHDPWVAYQMTMDIDSTAGHLLEVFSFARRFGYTVPTEESKILDFVLAVICQSYENGVLSRTLGLQHLRRGITLRLELDSAEEEGRRPETIDLAKYTVNVQER